MIKRHLLTLLALILCLGASGQTTAVTTEADSTVQVIAYFCKGDTLTYTYHHTKWKITDGDTLSTLDLTETFRLAVLDSTSQGYHIEYTPVSCTFDEESDGMSKILSQRLWEVTKELRPVFQVSELGAIEHMTNWRDIQRGFRRGVTLMFDSLYASAPEMEKVIPRKRYESLIHLKYANEQGIISVYEEMQTLFSLHGREFTLGNTELDDSTSYPSHISLFATYEAEDKDDDDSFEGDYRLQGTTITHLSADESATLAGSILGILTTDSISGKVEQALRDSLTQGISIKQLEDYRYFFNGWPRLMRTQKISGLPRHLQIDERSIEWAERSWGNYAPQSEEPRRSL